MTNKKEIVTLFEKPKFRKYSFDFYKQPMSFSEIEEKYETTRQTINNHFEVFRTEERGFNGDYIKTTKAGRKDKHEFKTKLAVDWLTEIANLNEQEVDWLSESLKKEEIDSYLRESSASWANFCWDLAYSWGMMLFFYEVGKLEEIGALSEALAGEEDIEYSMNEDLVNSIAEINGITDMAAKTTFFFQPIKKNPERAERIFEKLKNANFPFDKNPFKGVETNVNAQKIMWNGLYSEMAEQLKSKFGDQDQ